MPKKKLSWKGMKREYIVSKYTNYENINTEYAYCKFFLRIKYYREGYKSMVVNPPYSVVKKLYDWFGWRTLRSSDITFELVDYNEDQVRRWSPYWNFN